MPLLDLIEDRLTTILESLVTLFFLFILCLTVLLVVLRYGFNSSIIWGSEAMNYLFIYTTALGAAVSVSAGTHIKISCVKDLTRGRWRKIVDFVGCLLVGTINVVMGWFSLPWIISAGSFESPVMRMPMWVVQITVPLGCALASLICLMHMIRIATGAEREVRGESC